MVTIISLSRALGPLVLTLVLATCDVVLSLFFVRFQSEKLKALEEAVLSGKEQDLEV